MSLTTRQELSTRAPRDASTRPLAGLSIVAALLEQLRRRLALARHARAMNALDARQRADAGIDPVTARPPRPIIEVERGLMSRLMEMR